MCRKTKFFRNDSTIRRAAIGFALALIAAPAGAQIYRCVDDAGNLTFSQVPCPGQATSKVDTGSRRASNADCSWATRFAHDVARRMRSGRSSEDAFGVYGGINAVSAGTLNLINYVYRYEHAGDVSVERIASLTGSMCSAGSLGDVSCEALPVAAGDDPDRCDAGDADDDEADQAAAGPGQTAAAPATAPAAQPPRATRTAPDRSEAVRECKQPIRDQIDAINESMRDGYSAAKGESYRERLRDLSRRYRECDRL